MNISVRVLSAAARTQIAQLQAQVKGLQGQLAASNATSAGGILGGGAAASRSRKSIGAIGNQIQWTGRQLQYNWTVPLLLAGGAATKFALDNEKAMTHVAKVYGDAADAQAQYRKEGMSGQQALTKQQETFKGELNSLGKAFEGLSNYYGVQRKEVLETAGAWAAAGSSGVALAQSTELSLKAAVLGDMSLAKATDSLISIQAQYGENTKDLNLTLAELNAIENQTGISMQGLIDGFTRSAGVAREAGVDVRHLGAMLAALVPATGSATTAGNALKTIISRLMSPTKDSADVMKAFGVDTSKAAWQSMTAMERLMTIAHKMDDTLTKTGKGTKSLADDGYQLSDSQKQVVASVLGSRYQMNRFLVLMRELSSTHGYYQKALNATKNDEKVFSQATSELNTVLKSSPQRLKILWTTIQNGAADAIQPLIPYLLYLVQLLSNTVAAFSHLDPSFQKLILLFLLLLAAVGPVTKIFGSFLTLIYTLGTPVRVLTGLWAGHTAKVAATAAATGEARLGLMGLFKVMLITGPIRLMGVALGWLLGQSLILGKGMMALPAVFKGVMRVLPILTAEAVAGMGAAARGVPLVIGFMIGSAKMLPAGMTLAWTVTRSVWIAGVTSLMAIARTIPLVLVAASMGSKIFVEASGGMWLAVQRIWVLGMGQLAMIARTVPLLIASMGIGFARLPALVAGSMAGTVRVFRAGIAMLLGSVRIGSILEGLSAAGAAIVGAISAPVLAIIAGVVAIIVIFRKQLMQIWDNIVKYFSDQNNAVVKGIINAWNMLPQGVQNALQAVVNIVASAAKAVYSWLSYLNPFAHHSPSLVENVTNGMDVVMRQYARMDGIASHIKNAYKYIQQFSRASADLMQHADDVNYASERAQIKKFSPGALESFNKLVGILRVLKKDLANLQVPLDKQQAVVDAWQKKVDNANHSLDEQTKILDKLTAVQTKYQNLVDAAKDKLSDYANAPIQGMKAMNDAIFDNDQAQKKLQLQMMKMEDVTGPLDDIKAKMDAINGAQELLSGERSDLRAAGAGSDILGQYDDQIKALDDQKTSYTAAADAMQNMQDQLDALQKKGQELDLENSLEFDPLTKQINDAADAMKELPFDQIMAGVTSAQADIAKYGAQLDIATAAVTKQQAVVDAYTAVRDKYQDSLDAEEWKLKQIKDRYDDIDSAIQKVSGSLSDASSAAAALDQADKAKKKKAPKTPKLSPAMQNFENAKGGNFAKIGGDGIPMRTDWSNQSKQIDDFTADLAKRTGKMFGNINPFSGLKSKWNDFKSWMGKEWDSLGKVASDFFSHAFAGTGIKLPNFGHIFDGIISTGRTVMDWLDEHVFKHIRKLWDAFWPPLKELAVNTWKGIVQGIQPILKELKPLFKELRELGPTFKVIWSVVGPILKLIAALFVGLALVVIRVVSNTIIPIFKTIGGVIANALQVIRGALQILSGFFTFLHGLFTLNFGEMLDGVKKMAAGVYNIFAGFGGIIGNLLKGAFQVIVGVVWGIVKGIWDWFKWLWDELVGHSIIPDMINGIINCFKLLAVIPMWVWNNLVMPVVNFIKSMYHTAMSVFGWWWGGIKDAWKGLLTAGAWIWNNVLKPVWDKVKYLWTVVKAAFNLWWAGIKAVWNVLLTLGAWVWNNILNPVLTRVKNLWTNVKTQLGTWWSGIKSVWNSLTGLGTWVKNNVMDPVFNRITGAWKSVRDWLSNNVNMLKKPMESIVNTVIGAVNTIIRGLNGISKILPGISFHIDLIPKLAVGGEIPTKHVGAGFKTTGPRAIVGEGKQNHPEYVIPTDPTHRRRATALLAAAANDIGMGSGAAGGGAWGDTPGDMARITRQKQSALNGVPMYSIGGVLGSVGDAVGGAMGKAKDLVKGSASWIKGNIRKLATTPFTPYAAIAKAVINHAGWDPAKGLGNYGLGKAWEWVHGADSAAYEKATKVNEIKASGGENGAAAIKFARAQVGKPYVWGGVGPGGYDCSGFMSALVNVYRGNSPYSRLGSTANFPWSGFAPGTGSFTIGSTPNYGGSGVGHMAGTIGKVNVESRGGVGPIVGGGARGYNDGGFRTHAHIGMALKEGGIALSNRGPTLATIGDGRYDEAVVPLPKGWRNDIIGSSGGDTHVHINGNLEFPNIKDGSDAKTFISNLEMLVRE